MKNFAKPFIILLLTVTFFVGTYSTFAADMGMPADVISHCWIVTGPHIDYNTIDFLVPGDEIKVLARNPHGTMVFIWSEKADGWFPSWAVDVRGADFDALSVWETPMNGAYLTTRAQVQ